MAGLSGMFGKRAEQPIEARDYGKLYFTLSALLFIATMWSVIDEIATRRPWKETQQEYHDLSIQKWTERLAEAKAGIDSAAAADLQRQLDTAEEAMRAPEMIAAKTEIAKLEDELLDANRDFTFAKSRGDEAYYFWKKSVHEGHEDKSYEASLREHEQEMAAANARVGMLTARRDSLAAIVSGGQEAIRAIRAKHKELFAPVEAATVKLERLHASPVQIMQVMSNNFDRTNFGTPKARIDRCQTCHMGWKDELMDSVAQPFRRHSMPELLKIHNPETFGCTPCHRGQGTALTAGMAHGEADHYWEWPLLKGREVYASCNSCHANQTYVKYGGQFNTAKRLLAESGCFGCHEIKGLLDMPKIGPQLNQLVVKEKPEWLFRWVRNPKDYNAHTRMPNFRFSDDQAEAITAYLWSIGSSGSFQPQRGIASGGNAANGRKVVETYGCKGCHVIGDDVRVRQARGTSYDIAPELNRVGSKVHADWAFEWIRNPRAVNPDARMPNLRLEDDEIRDVVAYLMTLKDDRTFEEKELQLGNPELVKKGEKLIREYGCGGCHAIKGMEKESRVSVALSNFGRKRVDELDFGDTHVAHTWDDWVFGKIKDARQYTTDRIISKMPVFSFADSEIVALRTLLRGYTKEVPEPDYQQKFDKRQQEIEAGRRLTHFQYQCVSCHQIEEQGGYIKAMLEDEALAPPYLFPEGAKVQEPWLHSFIKAPSPIRPWLTITMPTFGVTDEEITTVSKYFLGLSRQELQLRDYQAAKPDPHYLKVGKQLFEDLQCLSCHYTGRIPEGKTPADLAPNLVFAKSRLKPDWIVDWIADPAAIQPGTRMPQFWPDLKETSPYSEEFGGDAREQIKAIRDYLMTIQGSR